MQEEQQSKNNDGCEENNYSPMSLSIDNFPKNFFKFSSKIKMPVCTVKMLGEWEDILNTFCVKEMDGRKIGYWVYQYEKNNLSNHTLFFFNKQPPALKMLLEHCATWPFTNDEEYYDYDFDINDKDTIETRKMKNHYHSSTIGVDRNLMYYFFQEQWPTFLHPLKKVESDNVLMECIDTMLRMVPKQLQTSANMTFAFFEWSYGDLALVDPRHSKSFTGWQLSLLGHELRCHAIWKTDNGKTLTKELVLPAEYFCYEIMDHKNAYDITGMTWKAFDLLFKPSKDTVHGKVQKKRSIWDELDFSYYDH